MRSQAEEPVTVLRFSPSARAFHWSLAFPTLALLASGLPLFFPSLRWWLRGYDARVGVRLHLASSLFLLAPLMAWALGDRRELRAEARELFRVTRGDWLWLPHLPGYLLGLRSETRPVGRYNVGQKLNAWAVVLGLLGLTLTGLLLWLEVPSDFVHTLRWYHDALSLGLGLLLLGHIFLVTFHPRTRPALRGMLDGRVPAEWAARQYPRWTDGSPATREGGAGRPRRRG